MHFTFSSIYRNNKLTKSKRFKVVCRTKPTAAYRLNPRDFARRNTVPLANIVIYCPSRLFLPVLGCSFLTPLPINLRKVGRMERFRIAMHKVLQISACWLISVCSAAHLTEVHSYHWWDFNQPKLFASLNYKRLFRSSRWSDRREVLLHWHVLVLHT